MRTDGALRRMGGMRLVLTRLLVVVLAPGIAGPALTAAQAPQL